MATMISSHEFNQDANGAKEAAQKGPVFITDHGRAGHVLMTIEEYERLTGKSLGSQTLADLLAMPGVEDIGFDPPQIQGPLSRAVDLS